LNVGVSIGATTLLDFGAALPVFDLLCKPSYDEFH
jgi:hypothetical protein